MIERASGLIVNVTTMVASFGQPGTATYRAIPWSAVTVGQEDETEL
jgi:hypothetical protein